jgi:hypothetical protein
LVRRKLKVITFGQIEFTDQEAADMFIEFAVLEKLAR